MYTIALLQLEKKRRKKSMPFVFVNCVGHLLPHFLSIIYHREVSKPINYSITFVLYYIYINYLAYAFYIKYYQ